MELKVRVYDKERKRFIYNVGLMPPGIQGQPPYLITSEYIYIRPGDPIAEKFYAIDYYTNLKDRHGNEIYENDIFELLTHRRKAILFVNGGFGYYVFGDFVSFAGHNHLDVVLQGEVIGNIHENPELLTEQKTNG